MIVVGLDSNTAYQFRVSISDNGYSDSAALLLETKTYIPRTAFHDFLLCSFFVFSAAASFQLEEGTHNSLRVSWAASPQGAYYELWYRKLVATRSVSDGFTLFSQLGSGTHGEVLSFVNTSVALTDATVTGLETSKAYELLLLAGRDGETEQVGVRLTARTASAEDDDNEDEGGEDDGEGGTA